MARIFEYSLIRLMPFAHRGELLNIGVLIFREEGLDIRLSAPSSLLTYFNISARAVDWISSRIKEMDDPSLNTQRRVESLSRATGYTLSEIGWFTTDEESQYEERISGIISEYVDRPRKSKARTRTTNVTQELKILFKGHSIYGKNINDIERHKVVSNVPVGPYGRLHVDFMLKNSNYHATETLDFRNSDHAGASEIKNAALANVTFQHVRESLESSGVKCYLVYSAPSVIEEAVKPAIQIAQHEVTESFNLESREDKRRYLDIMLSAAGNRSLFN